jgi:hypothetical protein
VEDKNNPVIVASLCDMGKVKVLSDFQSHPAGVLFFSISF